MCHRFRVRIRTFEWKVIKTCLFLQTCLRHVIVTTPKQLSNAWMWLDERFYFLDTSPKHWKINSLWLVNLEGEGQWYTRIGSNERSCCVDVSFDNFGNRKLAEFGKNSQNFYEIFNATFTKYSMPLRTGAVQAFQLFVDKYLLYFAYENKIYQSCKLDDLIDI